MVTFSLHKYASRKLLYWPVFEVFPGPFQVLPFFQITGTRFKFVVVQTSSRLFRFAIADSSNEVN